MLDSKGMDMDKVWTMHNGERFFHKNAMEFLECDICHRSLQKKDKENEIPKEDL